MPQRRLTGVSTTASIEAEATGTEGHDLQQTTGHRDVLEEVNELVLIVQRMMEGQCRDDAERCQDCGYDTGAITCDQRQATAHFNNDRHYQRQLGKRQPNGADV